MDFLEKRVYLPLEIFGSVGVIWPIDPPSGYGPDWYLDQFKNDKYQSWSYVLIMIFNIL